MSAPRTGRGVGLGLGGLGLGGLGLGLVLVLGLGLGLGACGDGAASAPPHGPRVAVDTDPDPRVVHVGLRAAPAEVEIGGVRTDALAFDGQVPGPTIRASVGDTLVVDIDNAMDLPTTVHWHGVHAPWAMDGAPWKVAPIAPDGHFTARFTLDRAGTFWYHPHFDSAREVDRGLYGAIIVADPREPVVDDELVLVFDAWGEEAEADESDEADDPMGHGDPDDDPHAVDDRARRWIVNGLDDPRFTVGAGGAVRGRLVNASNTGYLALGPSDGAAMTLIGSDQGLVSAPRGITEADRLVLAPGDRADVLWQVGSAPISVTTARYSLNGGLVSDPAAPIEVFAMDPTGPLSPTPRPAPADFPFDGLAPSPDPGTTAVVWVLEGSPRGFTINGERFPDVTVPVLAYGEDAVLEVRNLSATHHPFHLHGMPFEVLSIDGRAPAERTIEDTLDIPIRGAARLLVHADNPGEWMAHCHILPHAAGMMTLLEVSPP